MNQALRSGIRGCAVALLGAFVACSNGSGHDESVSSISSALEACPAAWQAGVAYVVGNRVSLNGNAYQARWWTQDNPTTANGPDFSGKPWTLPVACGSGGSGGTASAGASGSGGTAGTGGTAGAGGTAGSASSSVAAWQTGTAYVTGQKVTYNGKTYQCLQSHTSQPGWTPTAAPSLWQEVAAVRTVTLPAGSPGACVASPWVTGVSLPKGSYISYQGTSYRALQTHTSAASNAPGLDAAKWVQAQVPTGCEWCPPNAPVILLTDGSDVETVSAANYCIVAGDSADTVRTSSGNATLVGSNGDDTLYAGPDNHVYGGYGRDTIFGYGSDDIFVVPGPGNDTVSTANGDDIIAIYDLCEVMDGETIDAGGGQNVLITPVSIAELQALGVTINPAQFTEIRIENNSCKSECVNDGASCLGPTCTSRGTGICDKKTLSCSCGTDYSDDNDPCTASSKIGGLWVHRPIAVGEACPSFAGDCPGSTPICDQQRRCVCPSNDPDDDNECTTNEPGGTWGSTYLHVPAPGASCTARFNCGAVSKCNNEGFCECHTGPGELRDPNPCTVDRCFDELCEHYPREQGTFCIGQNGCNGTCDQLANCGCTDTTPAVVGTPIRAGTVNVQFLTSIWLANEDTGHGFAGCHTDWLGDTDFECLAKRAASKILPSEYDFLVMNEVFSEAGRDELIDRLVDDEGKDGKFPHAIWKMDADYNWSEFPTPDLDDSGLMILSKWPFDELSEADEECLDGHLDNEVDSTEWETWGTLLQFHGDAAVGFVGYDDAAGDDNLAKKGLGWARLVAPGGRKYNVFFSHMQASYSGQGVETWYQDSFEIREKQLRQVASLVTCMQGTNQAEASIFAGDLNINGELANPMRVVHVPWTDFSNCHQVCTGTGACEWYINGTSTTKCTGYEAYHELEKGTDVGQNRYEWDNYFLPGNYASRPPHPFHNTGLRDTWAEYMTPICKPMAHGDLNATAACMPIGTIPSEGGYTMPLKGSHPWDQGFSVARQEGEERLDYIFLQEQDKLTPQHVTLAWNLFADSEDASGPQNYEGGITPKKKGLLLGGTQNFTDHIGVNAEIDKKADFANPANAFSTLKKLGRGRPTELESMRLPYKGGVHWFKIDQPGSWTFNVNPVNRPGVAGAPQDLGIEYRVYEKSDFSRPMAPIKGEVMEVPPSSVCAEDFHSDTSECHEVPGFRDAKFRVVDAPLYVKVFHPGDDYPSGWTGDYQFLYHRALCTNQDEACDLAPFQGYTFERLNNAKTDAIKMVTSTSGADLAPLIKTAFEQTYPDKIGDPMWYALHVETPDSTVGQTLTFAVRSMLLPGNIVPIEKIELVRADNGTVVASDATPDTDSLGGRVWKLDSSDGSLDVALGGASNKFFIKVYRAIQGGVAGDAFNFTVGWHTNLTWFYAADLGGIASDVQCQDSTDWGEDELYFKVKVDGQTFPNDWMPLDLNFDEDDHAVWTDKAYPRLGSNAHGKPFSEQKGFKYVDNLTVDLLEDDDGFNGSNDRSSFKYEELGPLPGPVSAPGSTIKFGGNEHYDARGGTLAHSSPVKNCSGDAECAAPLKCRANVCRQ